MRKPLIAVLLRETLALVDPAGMQLDSQLGR